MRKMMALLLLTTLTAFVQAQQKYAVKGVVKDNTKKPVSNATAALYKTKDSSLLKTDITQEDGTYSFNIASGSYYLIVSSLGFETKKIGNINIENAAITIPEIQLATNTQKLKDVTVVSKKPMFEVKADKTIFNVEQSINATGSNAMELLQKSPGVLVDNNDNISMKGKTGVRIYIDGKMTQLNTSDLAAYLKSINSNDIESIEMISNPSAKYDASGNAGIINIKLKKNKKFGTNGSTNLGFVQGVTPKGNGSLNLNYRNKKINVFSNVSTNIGQYENALNLYRIQKDSLYDQKGINRSHEKSVNVKAGADYFANAKSTFGVIVNANISDNTFNGTSNTPIYFQPTNTYQKTLIALNRSNGSRTNASLNFNYRYADTSGKEINADMDYGIFSGTNNAFQPNYYVDQVGSEKYRVINRIYTPTDIGIFTSKVDVEQKAFKGKIGYGAKISNVRTKNAFNFYNEDNSGNLFLQLNRSNGFEYNENVNAAYLNYNRQLNTKWSIQAGLRMEQTNSKGVLTRADGVMQDDNIVKRNYLDFFPSAAASWTVNKKNTLNLTYSRRIDRPSYQDLNPFENKLDELTYEKGNAFLRPQYTNNIELTHTFLGFLNTAIGYSNVRDYATQVTDTLKNATYVQQRNLAKQEIFSVNISSPLPIKKWWNGFANIYFNQQIFNGVIGENAVNVKISTYGAYMQHSFTLGKDYTAELSGWYNGPSVWGGTWRTRQQGAIDMGVQKVFMKKKATAKLSVTDIFFTAPWYATNDFGGTFIKGNGNWESRTVRLSFSYRFGSNNIKSARQRNTGLENEANRIKGGK